MNIFEMPVHPAAEVFPMLDTDELQELADDIKTNGLQQPIVVKDGVLIDGRNRRAACEVAGIEPTTVELNGQEPVAFILSSNINRRHMTKGQRAMAVAMIYPEPKRGIHSESRNETGDISKQRLSQARTVLKYAPDLADGVMGGSTSLDTAYKQAKERKDYAQSDDAKLQTLKAEAADLADMVVEDGAELSEQWAAFKTRQENEKANRIAIYKLLAEAVPIADALRNASALERNLSVATDFPDEFESYTGRTVDQLSVALNTIKETLNGQ